MVGSKFPVLNADRSVGTNGRPALNGVERRKNHSDYFGSNNRKAIPVAIGNRTKSQEPNNKKQIGESKNKNQIK
jgi:hypothetical protein